MFSSFIIFVSRILKKVTVLKHLTIVVPIAFNNKKTFILLRKGIGYPNLFIKEDFILELLSLFLPLRSGVFLDVGVNIGQTLLKVKTVDTDRPYIGFEPNAVCVDYAKELIRLNGYTNCEVREYALSDKNDVVKLALNEVTDASASMVENLRPGYFKDSVHINCVAFDESGITDKIALLKIDVEGAESEVLMGMKKAINTFQPLIICEVLDCYCTEVLEFTQQRADSLCGLLRTHDYVIFRLHQDKRRIDSFERVDSILIRMWSTESYALNDYLFCHATFEQEMIGMLNQLSRA